VFIATQEKNKETVTSAKTGRVDVIGDSKFLVLNQGQRLERTPGKANMSISLFGEYAARVGADDNSSRDYSPASAASTLALLTEPTPLNQGELAWRVGLTLAALNLVIIGLASAGVNPRAGRTGNLIFAFLAFVVYFNLLVLGKSWIENGQVHMLAYLVILHGGTLALALLWLAKRHHSWTFFGRQQVVIAKDAT
jgi:lipopolysaccharide export system permease protein